MSFDFTNYEDRKSFERLYPLVHLIKPFVYKTTIVGKENIPEKNGFIVICNHIHAVDPGQIEFAFDGRPIHFMGKSEFWDNPVLGRIFTKCNGFPVVRGKADMKSLEYASELLRRGHNVGVFPEGTRQKKAELGRPKNGAALMARASHADILPICIYHEDDKMGASSKATMRIGKLIPFETLGLTDDGDNHELKEASLKMWSYVEALWSEGFCKE